MTLSVVKAVLFDAYGTLFDVHSPVARVAAELGPNAAAISDLWRVKQLQYTWLRSLMRAHADFDTVTADALDFALAQYGVNDQALRDRLLGLYLTLDAYPDATSALRTLRAKGIVTGILSNGSPHMLEAAVSSAGLTDLLDHVLSIESVGIYKPDPRVYQLAVDRLGVPAERICFVSNNAWDSHGAAHFGLRVARLNRFDQPAEKLPGSMAAVMSSLAELPPLLGL